MLKCCLQKVVAIAEKRGCSGGSLQDAMPGKAFGSSELGPIGDVFVAVGSRCEVRW